MNFETPNLIYPMKEYRPVVVPNPFKKYYLLGAMFLILIIFSVFQDKPQIRLLFLGVASLIAVILFFVIQTVKYTVLVRFVDSFLRIEYLDYRKRSFFLQIPYFELSAKISIERTKYQTYAVLRIARNGEKVIRIDENTSNFSRTEISDIYKDILKLNPSNG